MISIAMCRAFCEGGGGGGVEFACMSILQFSPKRKKK